MEEQLDLRVSFDRLHAEHIQAKQELNVPCSLALSLSLSFCARVSAFNSPFSELVWPCVYVCVSVLYESVHSV